MRTDPRFYHQTEEDLLRGYRDICKRIDAHLPKLFRTLPRLPYGVRKIPDFMAPHTTTAYYSGGDIRNAEPGYFYANTYALDQRPKYEMIALALHEVEGPLMKKFLSNLSERAAGMLKEEIEFLGTVRPGDQEGAQQELIQAALKLEQEEKLVFSEPEG